jgi:hypothetical protein
MNKIILIIGETNMSERKFLKIKITVDGDTYAETKIADKDYGDFVLELDNLLRKYEIVTGC